VEAFLFFVSEVLIDGVGFRGRVGPGAGNAVGQYRTDFVQRQAVVHAIRETVTIGTIPARALYQVADVKIKTMSVVICHGYGGYGCVVHLPAVPFSGPVNPDHVY
jgi:hypothetical protein